MKKKLSAWLLAALLLLTGCSGETEPLPTADPYRGMVSVPSGHGTEMWVDLHEDVLLNTLRAEDFAVEQDRVVYTGTDVPTLRGIDVSEHQGVIDWAAVAADDIDFAIIRAGYRGYSEGGLFEDAYFQSNMNGAAENDLPVGLYFFSQATSVKEAKEEAEFLLEHIRDYDPATFDLPIFYDWETIGVADARTDDVPAETVTACAKAFCETIAAAGYTPGVYAYRYLGYFTYDLSQLTDYPLWMGAVGNSPDFYYRHDIWQYSIEGKVKGIRGDVDLNLMFLWDRLPAAQRYAALEYRKTDGSGTFAAFSADDSAELATLLNAGAWAAGDMCDCDDPHTLKSGAYVLRYCPDCGMFFDDGQVLTLNKKTRRSVNALLEPYVAS